MKNFFLNTNHCLLRSLFLASLSETLERSRIERAGQLLIDSFAQTEMPSDEIMASTSSTICQDMADSGVSSQHLTYKERNISVTEEDEAISLSDDRYRYKSVSEEEMEEVREETLVGEQKEEVIIL